MKSVYILLVIYSWESGPMSQHEDKIVANMIVCRAQQAIYSRIPLAHYLAVSRLYLNNMFRKVPCGFSLFPVIGHTADGE